MTVKHHDTSREPWWTMTKHHNTSWHITTHHETSWNIMNYYKAPLIITICTKIIVNYPQKMYYNINTYSSHITFTCTKNWQTGICLRKGPKPHLLYLFYSKSSPTLKTNRRSILTKLTYGRDPLPRNFPISWYWKLDTGMHKPNIHPELKMQQML